MLDRCATVSIILSKLWYKSISVLSKLSTVYRKNPTPRLYLQVLLSRTPWLGLAINVTCVTSQFLSPTPPYVTHRHNNVNPSPPSERDVIYGRPLNVRSEMSAVASWSLVIQRELGVSCCRSGCRISWAQYARLFSSSRPSIRRRWMIFTSSCVRPRHSSVHRRRPATASQRQCHSSQTGPMNYSGGLITPRLSLEQRLSLESLLGIRGISCGRFLWSSLQSLLTSFPVFYGPVFSFLSLWHIWKFSRESHFRMPLSKENFQMWHTRLCRFLLAKVNFQK